MKKTISFINRNLKSLFIAAVGIAIFTGCNKSLDSDTNYPDVPVAGLMAFNLTADKTIGFSLSGNYLTSQPLGYANYTGSYLRIYTGNRSVEVRDGYSNNQLATSTATFDSSRYYSTFALGANGAYRNVTVNDNFDSLSGTNGQAYVRYINAVPDSVNAATVTISSNGSTISNRTASYGTVSAFTTVTPGQVNIAVSKNGVNKNRTIALEQQKVYTVLVMGMGANGNVTDSIDIRFVLNGTLDNTNTNGRTTSNNPQSISIQ